MKSRKEKMPSTKSIKKQMQQRHFNSASSSHLKAI